MSLPFFYEENLNDTPSFTLSEESSKHITHVLRMQTGEQIQLTNGEGKVLTVEITAAHKKATKVMVLSTTANDQQTTLLRFH